MKSATRFGAALWLALLFSALSVLPASAQNFIRQKLLNSGVTYHYFVTQDTGSGYAFIPVDEESSFELFAKGTAWDTNYYFLDIKTVGYFLPQASINIVSDDPHVPVRTRADKPYQLQISVSGLSVDPAAHLAARQVLYTHSGINYIDGYVPGVNAPYVMSSALIGNMSPSFTPVYTGLVPMAPTKAMGIERFQITSLTDETVLAPSILAKTELTVWPVSEAIIEGIDTGEPIRDRVPMVRVHLKDLYPKSTTYAQIYPGAPALGTLGDVVLSSLRVHDTVVPQNEIITISHLDVYFSDDGIYTLEILSETPFNGGAPERLAHVSFEVQRKVFINGQTTTLED